MGSRISVNLDVMVGLDVCFFLSLFLINGLLGGVVFVTQGKGI